MLLWAAIVIVVPNTAVLASEVLSPVPTYNQNRARIEEARQEIIQGELRAYPRAQSIFETPNARQVIFRILEIDQQMTDEYLARKSTQLEHARLLASLSPAGALVFGLSDVAGTGVSAYRSYLSLFRAGRDLFIDAYKRRWDLPAEEGGRLVREAEKEVASLRRRPEPIVRSVRSATPAIASLVLWLSFLGLAVYWRFERYDVR